MAKTTEAAEGSRAKGLWRALLLAGRLALGGIFVFAAYTKLHFNGAWHLHDYQFFFAMSIDAYRLLPLPMVERLAAVLPWVELALGALLLSGIALRWAGAITCVLLAIFMAALVHAVRLNLDICGCFGQHSVKPSDELLQDSGLLLVALAVTVGAFLAHRARRLPA